MRRSIPSFFPRISLVSYPKPSHPKSVLTLESSQMPCFIRRTARRFPRWFLEAKLSYTIMSFSRSNRCWTAGSHGRVLNGSGDQRCQFAKDIELIRNLFISVWSQCQTEKTKCYVDNMHDFLGTVAQRTACLGIIPSEIITSPPEISRSWSFQAMEQGWVLSGQDQ